MVAARRGRGERAAGGRGAPVRRRRSARSSAAYRCSPTSCVAQREREGRRRLPRGAASASRTRSREPRRPGRRAARRARARPAARHRPHEPALRHRVHRAATAWRSSAATSAPLRDRLPLRRAGRPARCWTSTASRGRRTSSRRSTDGWPPGTLRLGFEDAHVTVRRPRPDPRRAARPDRARARRATSSRPSARSRTTASWPASAAPRGWPTTSTTGCASGGSSGAPSARWRSRSSTRCACAAPSDPSFPSIVASGRARRAPARRRPRDEPIPADTLVTLDIGAVLDGYCSDCTRTWATGDGLPGELREAYELVQRAQRAARGRRSGRARRAARSTRWRAR